MITSDQIHYFSVLTKVHVTHKRIIKYDNTENGQSTFIQVCSFKKAKQIDRTKETRLIHRLRNRRKEMKLA